MAEDAGFEPARRSRADHRFRDGCLTWLGQSSWCGTDAAVSRGGRADRTRAGSPRTSDQQSGALPLGQPSSATCPCTGSLSVLLAEAGHHVRGLDLSTAMLGIATRKAEGLPAEFRHGDAADPPYPPASCDVVLARHVLWALPDPGAALARWTGLLAPGGRLVLVEGRWFTGAGLPSAECEALVRRHREDVTVTPLTDPALWGRTVDDERYLLVS
jgi:SAM-dependent methyltransferase